MTNALGFSSGGLSGLYAEIAEINADSQPDHDQREMYAGRY